MFWLHNRNPYRLLRKVTANLCDTLMRRDYRFSDALNTNNHTYEVAPLFIVIELAVLKYIRWDWENLNIFWLKPGTVQPRVRPLFLVEAKTKRNGS